MNSPDDLTDLLGAHAVQLAEWSQDPDNADAAVTLLVMAQHCNEAAGAIKRLHEALASSREINLGLVRERCQTDDEIDRLREALRECADDLEAEIKHRASGELPRRIARDLETVERARALLTPNTGVKGPAVRRSRLND